MCIHTCHILAWHTHTHALSLSPNTLQHNAHTHTHTTSYTLTNLVPHGIGLLGQVHDSASSVSPGFIHSLEQQAQQALKTSHHTPLSYLHTSLYLIYNWPSTMLHNSPSHVHLAFSQTAQLFISDLQLALSHAAQLYI